MTISAKEKKFHAALEAIHDLRSNSYDIRWATDLYQPDELIGITSIHETLHAARKEQQSYDARRNGQKVGAV